MDVYWKNLFDNHSKRMSNDGQPTMNNDKTSDKATVEIVIFDDNIISSQRQQPQPQPQHNSNNCNKQMVLNTCRYRSVMKDEDRNGDEDYDNDDKCSSNHDQNKIMNFDAQLCRRHILVHENSSHQFLLRRPRALLDNNYISSSSSSINSNICISDNHCTCNNNNEINRNTNATTCKKEMTARMEEHRLSRWNPSSPLVPKITQTSRSPEHHDILKKACSLRVSLAPSKQTATATTGNIMLPPQRQSSDPDSFELSITSSNHVESSSLISRAA